MALVAVRERPDLHHGEEFGWGDEGVRRVLPVDIVGERLSRVCIEHWFEQGFSRWAKSKGVLEDVECCRIRDDVDVDPENVVCRLVARRCVVEALVCVPVELLVEAESTAAVPEVVLDTLERGCDRCCV